jgi:hypothetical protein
MPTPTAPELPNERADQAQPEAKRENRPEDGRARAGNQRQIGRHFSADTGDNARE